MLNDKDKALFEKNSFTGWYHGNHCLMDAVQFTQALKEYREYKHCDNCETVKTCFIRKNFNVSYCSLFSLKEGDIK